jgi:hypothetical protein
MAQRRADGLCYNCDEKFVVGHRCKKLFVLEFTESDDEEAVDEEIECSALTATYDSPGISLHAITVTGVRVQGVQTVKLFVSVGDVVAVALLDSGSSHNFIDVDMACRAGITLSKCTGLYVVVANDERIPSPSSAMNQHICIGGEAFVIDLHDLPLGEYDMVLGVQWLGTLGPILWDFARCTLAFQWGGKHILSRGAEATPRLASAPLSTPGADLLDALLEDSGASSSHRRAFPHDAVWTITSALSWVRALSRSGCTATPICRKTTWSGNAMRCFAKVSFATARPHSCHQLCSSASPMARGVYVWITAPSMTPPSRTSFPSRWSRNF